MLLCTHDPQKTQDHKNKTVRKSKTPLFTNKSANYRTQKLMEKDTKFNSLRMVKDKIQINMASYLEYLIQKYLDLYMEKKHSLDYSHY